MKILKFIFFALLGFVGLYLLACAFMPNRFEVERSMNIEASPYVVFDQVNDFKNWDNWDPWGERDSSIVTTYGEVTAGLGASRAWTSAQSGNGHMEITHSAFLQQIDFDISISEWSTFQGHFYFEPSESGVNVRWMDEGDLPFLSRAFSPIFSRMMGDDFERGLTLLKEHCEALPYSHGDISTEEWPRQGYVYILDSCAANNISQTLGAIYGEIYQTLAQKGVMPISQPFAQYLQFPLHPGDEDKVIIKAGAFMPEGFELGEAGRMQLAFTQEGESVQVSHFGAYETSGNTHAALHAYCAENDIKVKGSAYELYITDPSTEPNQANWETRIIYEIE
jgi:effector-binding domain-containing protein